MNINIKTKFNIGDVVYIPEILNGEYYIDGPHKIKSIQLDVVNEDILIKYYCENIYTNVIENCCFISYEECKKWCLTHN